MRSRVVMRGRGWREGTSERCEEDLLLVRVLRDEAEVGAAVDHALLDLKDDTRASARRVRL